MDEQPTQPPPPPEPASWPHAAPGFHAAPGPHPNRRAGMPTWAKWLIGCGVAGVLMIALICGGIIYLGVVTPETRALAGSQLTRRNLDDIRQLGLLAEGERIKYFYSDGLLGIEEGMYFFTDDRIVVYGEDFEPSATIVSYDEVIDITVDFSDSWWVDGTIWVELADDRYVAIPISAEGGADEYFYDSLVETWQTRRQAAAAE